jgi:hypothetical protein
LEHTVEVVCVPPAADDADDDDPAPELELEPPIAIPDIDPELPAGPELEPFPAGEPAVFAAADRVDGGCDDASETVVAASTSTAATPTVASPAHHNRAPSPSADQRSRIDDLSCSIAILLAHLVAPSVDPRCQRTATEV